MDANPIEHGRFMTNAEWSQVEHYLARAYMGGDPAAFWLMQKLMAQRETSGRYRTYHVESLADIKPFFDGPTADPDYNWLFLSTSGMHGSYTTLDDIECVGFEPVSEWEYIPNVTFLVVMPRLVRTYFGNARVTADDVPWLREAVQRTLVAVGQRADGNLPKEELP